MSQAVCSVQYQARRERYFSLLVRIRQVALYLLVITYIGCTPVPPKVINIAKPEDYRPSTPGNVKSVEQAIAAVMTAAADSGLPKIDSLSLWLYENTEAFAYWGKGNAKVHEVANEAAVTKGNSIHVNLGSSGGTRWDLRIGELAHEFGHVLHNSLAGSDLKHPGGLEKVSPNGWHRKFSTHSNGEAEV